MTLQKRSPYDEALVVLTLPCASWAYHLADNAETGLRDIGYRVTQLQIDSQKKDGQGSVAELTDLLTAKMTGGDRFFLLDFQGRVQLDIIERLRIPRFSWIGDHPFIHMEAILKLAPHSVIGVIDRAHVHAARAGGVRLPIAFTPHGAPVFDTDPRPMADRGIAALFAAGVHAPTDRRTWAEQHPSVPDVVTNALFAALEAVIEEGADTYSAVESALRRSGIEACEDLRPDALWRMVGTADLLAEAEVRFRVLGSLASLPLHFVGPDLPACYAPFSGNWTCHGPKTYDEVCRLMGESRIGLNTIAKFSDGSHERVWEAMARGAVALTDRTPYLAESFEDGESILFLPRGPAGRDGLADRLTDLLGRPDELDRIAAAGRDICERGHRWAHRALAIDRAMAEAAGREKS